MLPAVSVASPSPPQKLSGPSLSPTLNDLFRRHLPARQDHLRHTALTYYGHSRIAFVYLRISFSPIPPASTRPCKRLNASPSDSRPFAPIPRPAICTTILCSRAARTRPTVVESECWLGPPRFATRRPDYGGRSDRMDDGLRISWCSRRDPTSTQDPQHAA